LLYCIRRIIGCAPSKGVFLIVSMDFTDKEFRRLLDMVYIGNWILNSTRGDDRFTDYDDVERKIFAQCAKSGMFSLVEIHDGVVSPSPAFEEGGIHEAIMDYEDAVFFEILAEELARKDMESEHLNPEDMNELNARIDDYITEFEEHGIDNVSVEK